MEALQHSIFLFNYVGFLFIYLCVLLLVVVFVVVLCGEESGDGDNPQYLEGGYIRRQDLGVMKQPR